MLDFKPRERLEYIQQLKATGLSGQCLHRCMVHQAYYAALNQLQYEIDNRLFFPIDADDRKFKSHQAFIDACYNQIRKLDTNAKEKRELLNRVVQNMKRAKAVREKADYHLQEKIVQSHVSLVLECSNQIFDDLEAYQ